MTGIAIRAEFALAHRLMNHGGKCAKLHGHNYTLEVHISGVLDQHTGMLMDFSDFKAAVRAVTDKLDHKTMLHQDDPMRLAVPDAVQVPWHPTVENIVQYIARQLNALPVVRVTLSETRDCWGFWTESNFA